MIPIQSIRNVVAFLRGELVPQTMAEWLGIARDINAVIQFGIEKLQEVVPQVMEGSRSLCHATLPMTTREDVARTLEGLAETAENSKSFEATENKVGAAAFPWKEVVTILAPILVDLLKKWTDSL